MTLGIVVIGRNEGERLRVCLDSLVGLDSQVVYVDSGSSDSSVELARSLGAVVVELDMSVPFSAARARNAGFEQLTELNPEIGIVQFVDGDCEVVSGWLDRARAELAARPDAAIVFGRVRERHPDRSIYNRLADLEWDTPIGETEACGGIFAIRAEAFHAVGGFEPTLIAGEEPELCYRLRQSGWRTFRVDAEMTWHDLDVTQFCQWWRRQVRSGYGSLDVTSRDDRGPFSQQVRSARFWTWGWLVALLTVCTLAAYIRRPIFLGLVALISLAPVFQAIRISWRQRHRLENAHDAIALGLLTMIGKWGEIVGQTRALSDRMNGLRSPIIEYKGVRSTS